MSKTIYKYWFEVQEDGCTHYHSDHIVVKSEADFNEYIQERLENWPLGDGASVRFSHAQGMPELLIRDTSGNTLIYELVLKGVCKNG